LVGFLGNSLLYFMKAPSVAWNSEAHPQFRTTCSQNHKPLAFPSKSIKSCHCFLDNLSWYFFRFQWKILHSFLTRMPEWFLCRAPKTATIVQNHSWKPWTSFKCGYFNYFFPTNRPKERQNHRNSSKLWSNEYAQSQFLKVESPVFYLWLLNSRNNTIIIYFNPERIQ
jgi:hypothetical protein